MTPGLYAVCPHCEAVFLLEEAHLNAKEGLVRCGACDEIFNAKWHLTEKPEGHSPEGPEQKAPAAGTEADSGDTLRNPESDEDDTADESNETGTGYEGGDASHARDHARVSDHRPAEWGGPPESSKLPPAHAGDDPQTSHAGGISMNGVDDYIAPRSRLLNRLLWSAAAFGLVALLGWQVKYPFMEKYVHDRDFRSVLSVGCDFFGCELPPISDLPRLTLTHTRIDLHPLEPGAIRVTVKLVNEAVFAQPYPNLQVILTDRDGRVVGRRTFPPDRYLEEGQPGLLGSGELGVVLFDLARPHKEAVGFEVNIVGGSARS